MGARAATALVLLALGCSSSSGGGVDGGTGDGNAAPSDAPGGSEAEAYGLAACVAAGGQCVQGVAFCGSVGPGATPGSCLDIGPAVLCCAVNADAGCSTEIQASKYDQTCTMDSDCVAISVGDPCEECVFACGANVGAINVGAMARYRADVDKTPAAVASCGCPSEQVVVPCCRGGQCHADNECSPLDGSADAADAGVE